MGFVFLKQFLVIFNFLGRRCKCSKFANVFWGGPTSATLRENPEGSFNAALDLQGKYLKV